jgi:hypothetical protein
MASLGALGPVLERLSSAKDVGPPGVLLVNSILLHHVFSVSIDVLSLSDCFCVLDDAECGVC